MQIDSTFNKLNTVCIDDEFIHISIWFYETNILFSQLREFINGTEDYINIQVYGFVLIFHSYIDIDEKWQEYMSWDFEHCDITISIESYIY